MPGDSMQIENLTFDETKFSHPVVLLVDDQPMVAEAVRRMLAPEGDIVFHYCQDPTKAIDVANQVKPTIVLQDLVMPDVDGLTLVRFYRANPTTAMVPIIVLSNKENPKDKSLAFAAGASDYLVKLPDSIELIARIRAHSRSYLTQLERDDAFRKLRELQAKLEESNELLQKLSCLDGLTGIANRRRFDDFMATEWMRAARKKTTLSLILVDIDYFKPYNDNYGHQQGDDCLRQVANILSTGLNRPADLLARYGGEEFVVVLPDTTLAGALGLGESLRARVEKAAIPHEFSAAAGTVTVSLGVAYCEPKTGDATVARLIEAADHALYEAKHAGRNKVVVSAECARRAAG